MAKRRKRKIRYDRIFIILAIIVFIFVTIGLIFRKQNEVSFDKKAVWFSYINMQSLKDNEETEFKNNFTQICETIKDKQLDTIIVQVRPFMDSIYPSDLFPISTSISSTNTINYDALEIMVDIAHNYNLKIEAWINPYRISYNESQLDYFRENSMIADWINSEHILINGSTAILNPASEKARNYIVSGVEEIINKYDIDGIHMDDYFYVETLFGNTTMEERCQNVNLLVKQLYQTIKNKDESITFGISPQGNLENARNIGADIDTWLSESGYVDYVMPQIYWSDRWGMDGSVEMFSTRVNAYSELHTNDNIKLYAGLALYLAGQNVRDDIGWNQNTDNLKRQSEILKQYGWNGFSLFDYDSMNDPSTHEELNNLLH